MMCHSYTTTMAPPLGRVNNSMSCSVSAAVQLIAVAIDKRDVVPSKVKRLLDATSDLPAKYNNLVPASKKRKRNEFADAHEVFDTLCGMMPLEFQRVYQGIVLDRSVCKQHGHAVMKSVNFTDLTLKVPVNLSCITLRELIEKMFHSENVDDYACLVCAKRVAAKHGTAYMLRLPSRLLRIVIQRPSNKACVKLHPFIRIHTKAWQLIGILVFVQNCHWVAYVWQDNAWWRCDDAEVTQVKAPYRDVTVQMCAHFALYRLRPPSCHASHAPAPHD